MCGLKVPHAFIITAFYIECIFSGREVIVFCKVNFCRWAPGFIKTFQLVGIQHFLRIGKADAVKFKIDVIKRVRQYGTVSK